MTETHDWASSTGLVDVTLNREVAVIALNRPDKLNALTLPMRRDLADAIRYFGDGHRTRGLVLTGRGRAFSAGEDLTSAERPDNEAAVRAAIESFHDLTRAVLATRVPTVAAVNGLAVGGACEFTLCFDARIGSPKTEIFLPENHLGLVVSNAASLLLPRLLGPSRATRFVLESRRVGAAEASQWGLLDKVVDDELNEETRDGPVVDCAIDLIHAWAPPGSATAAHLTLLRPSLTDVEDAMTRETEIAERVWTTGASRAGIEEFWRGKQGTSSQA